MFSLSLLFSSFVSWTAPGCPHGSLGVFKHLCYLHLENLCVPMKPFLFPYCLIFCCNLQTVVTPNKALEYFSFSSLIFSLQLSCLYNFIIFHCHILFFPFYLWSLGDIWKFIFQNMHYSPLSFIHLSTDCLTMFFSLHIFLSIFIFPDV